LPDDLPDPLGLGSGGEEVVRVGRLGFRKRRREDLRERLDAVARPRGDRDDVAEREATGEILDERKQRRLGQEIDLVEREDGGARDALQELDQKLLPFAAAL